MFYPSVAYQKKDGGFTLASSGGVGNFSYQWETGSSNTSVINGVGAGSYTITVSDGNGCTTTLPVEVGGPITVPFNQPIVRGETCKNRGDGSILLSASGGNGGLEYSIDGINFQNSGNFTDLLPGTYPIIVRDASGCGDESRVIVNGGTRFDLRNSIVTNAKCLALGGGQIILRPSGGLEPYTVSFEGGPFQNQLVFSELKGDTFDIIVRDASGCEKAFQQIIEKGSDLEVQFSEEDVTCAGLSDGLLSVITTGGVGIISYTLDDERPKFRATEFTDLAIGKHSILVRDQLDCRITHEFEIKEKISLTTDIIKQAPCSDILTGQITVLPQNGESPYQYSIDNGDFENNNVFENLSSKIYEIITLDNQGCTRKDTVDISAGDKLEIVFVPTKNETCPGYEDGQITVITNSANTDSLTYSIDGENFTKGNVFSGLIPGDYTVYARNSSCEASRMLTILGANPLIFQPEETRNPTCGGDSDGQISVFVAGGTAPYKYRLENRAFQSNNIFTNLSQGNYKITTQDANGCEVTTTILLFEPLSAVPECTAVQQITTKGATDGIGKVEVFGGSPPYNIQLIDANFNNRISLSGVEIFENLPAGTYTVEVMDRSNCKSTCEFTIEEPSCDLSLSFAKVDVTCFGFNDGNIDLAIQNGINPFVIDWSDDNFDGQTNISELSAGNYQVTVNDQEGCTASTEIIITQPQQLIVEIIKDNTTICENDSTNLALNQEFDGYNWSNGVETATNTIYESGHYQVTVVDEKGCSAIDSVNITTILQDTLYQTLFTCNIDQVGVFEIAERGLDGCMNIIFRTFELARKDTTQLKTTTCNPSIAGISSRTLSNAFGCDSLIITTTELLPTDTTFLMENSCDSDQIGIREVTERNQFGCDSLLVIETILEETIDLEFKTQFTCNAGEAIIDTLFLKNIAGCDSLIITTTELLPTDTTFLMENSCDSDQIGIREVIERNQFGCDSLLVIETILDETIDLEFKTQFTCNAVQAIIDTLFLKNPDGCDSLVITRTILNPSNITEIAKLSCEILEVGIDSFSLINQFLCDSLVIVTTTLAESHFVEFTEQSCNPQDTGLFIQKLFNQFECDSTVETKVILASFNDCQVSFSLFADTICWNEERGKINIQTTQGNPPFDYFIINENGIDTFEKGVILNNNELISVENLPVGDYTVQLVNHQNISKTQKVSIPQFSSFQINAETSNYNGFEISCEDETDGSIQVKVNNGKPPYSFVWNTGSTENSLNNLTVGNYKLTITDANNCTDILALDLAASNSLIIDYQSVSPKCFEDDYGQIIINDLTNVNGSAEYSLDGILFQPIGILPFTIENLIPTDYQLFIQDENDCQLNEAINVPMPKEKVLKLGTNQTLVLGDNLTLNPIANFEISRYEWTSNSSINCKDCPEITVNPTTNSRYDLTVYDENGCNVSNFILVNVRKENQVYIPNIFSPNDDGNNDVFQIYTGNSIKRIKLFQIIDHVGQLMYQVKYRQPDDRTIGWDGLFNGQKMLPSVFIVFVKVELLDGTEREYVQTMNLVK